jgi:DNA-binding NtrC family response regulator
MLTRQLLAEDGITALLGGAYDFDLKPINLDELEITVRNGLETGLLRKEDTKVRRELSSKFSFEQNHRGLPRDP